MSKLGDAPAVGLHPGWSDDGTTLWCANKQPVVLGFRDYLREKLHLGLWQGGDANPPQFEGPVDDAGTDGALQFFAAPFLLWDTARGMREGSLADALRVAAHERQGKVA